MGVESACIRARVRVRDTVSAMRSRSHDLHVTEHLKKVENFDHSEFERCLSKSGDRERKRSKRSEETSSLGKLGLIFKSVRVKGI